MHDTQSWASIESRIRNLPGGDSMFGCIPTGSSAWTSIAESLVLCSGFPSIEFNALYRSGEFDIRWPLTYAAWYFGSSGGSVDDECLRFLAGIQRQGDAKNALNEYTGPPWLDTWKAGMLTLLVARELPNNPNEFKRRIGRFLKSILLAAAGLSVAFCQESVSVMARHKSSLHTLFDQLIERSVTAVLRPTGFRKSALNFHRRYDEVVQVVNVQTSHGSSSDIIRFYVNVGIAFDAICQLMALEIVEKPKEYDCDSRGTRDRLENLVTGAEACWSIASEGDLENTARRLNRCSELLADELQKIRDVQSYRRHRWFDRCRPRQENAQIFYLLGDFDNAWTEVNALCNLFADRGDLSRPEWWIKELRLSGLAGRLESPTRQN